MQPLAIGESFDMQVKELLHKAINIGGELVAEFCTKSARKNGD